MSMHSRLNKKIFRLFGIALFAYILSKLELRALVVHLKEADFRLFAVALFLSAPNIFIKSMRWRYLARSHSDEPLSMLLGFRYYWAAIFWGGVTPGKVGELYKVKYLVNHGMKKGSALAVTLVDRLADVLCLLVLACVGMFYMSTGYLSEKIAVVLFLVAGIVITRLVMVMPSRFKAFVITTGKVIVAKKFPALSDESPLEDFLDAFKIGGAGKVAAIGLITVFTWLLFAGQRYIIAISLGMNISFVCFAVIMIIMALVSLIPVSVNGIGTRDAVLIYFLGSQGFSSETCVALSALILVVMLVNVTVGYIFYLTGGKFLEPTNE